MRMIDGARPSGGHRANGVERSTRGVRAPTISAPGISVQASKPHGSLNIGEAHPGGIGCGLARNRVLARPIGGIIGHAESEWMTGADSFPRAPAPAVVWQLAKTNRQTKLAGRPVAAISNDHGFRAPLAVLGLAVERFVARAPFAEFVPSPAAARAYITVRGPLCIRELIRERKTGGGHPLPACVAPVPLAGLVKATSDPAGSETLCTESPRPHLRSAYLIASIAMRRSTFAASDRRYRMRATMKYAATTRADASPYSITSITRRSPC